MIRVRLKPGETLAEFLQSIEGTFCALCYGRLEEGVPCPRCLGAGKLLSGKIERREPDATP